MSVSGWRWVFSLVVSWVGLGVGAEFCDALLGVGVGGAGVAHAGDWASREMMSGPKPIASAIQLLGIGQPVISAISARTM
jgi:hypothetical protein